ncbi:atherin isoform X2 [Fundulus heteroclitus]|uniref:atherin isoform X2 n=1 Tax=Fundulus heteroclitus TaxID=8078 RepID=UPI00165CD59E|nr:atherin isoform X2 [Fundulus heteroclitus]
MSEPNKYREWILETIDSLRSRKARPDLERICRMVRRRHGSDPDRTRTELEKLIQEQTVLKVSYKGSISYRNAAKVQRKSRKRSEFGGGADAPRERTKPDHPNNNGDSAHSFTDPEEGEEEPDPHAETSASSRNKKLQPASSPGSGNGRLGCGATTSCAVGSGCEEEKASAPRDKGLGQQGAGNCPPPGAASLGAGAGAPSEDVPPGGGKKLGVSGADTWRQTHPESDSQAQTRRQTESSQPKLRHSGGSTKTAHRHANSELRDKLAALSEKTHRGGVSAAASRGHVRPLGLKEILGYLSSQERLSEEKLTRGKVKVVMEREVERGRLRRTRCGNITLPLRGVELEEPEPRNASADRLARSALQDKRAVKKSPPPGRPESEPMETAGEEAEEPGGEEEEEEEKEDEDEEDDRRSCDEGAGLSPVAMTTEAGPPEENGEDAGFQTGPEEESPQQQRQDGKAACAPEMSGLEGPPESHSPPTDGASWSECNGVSLEDGAFASDHLSYAQQDETHLAARSLREYKTEVGASSCMLTPTASPRDSSLPEERGINDSSGGQMKVDGTGVSPVDWTVSDVVSYFTEAGFPEQAAAFRTQEIDGKSLLLMQRNDVLTGLSIKLGPALKIYERHIKVLQKTHFEDDDC